MQFSVLLRRYARRIANKCGFVLMQNSKPGRHIPFDHPALVHMREWLSLQISSGRINERLIANFDQTWSLNFVPARSSLNQRPVERDMQALSTHRKHLRHVIERALGMEFTDSQRADSSEANVRVRSLTGGQAAMGPVEAWRQPHTLTTLSWVDGTVGRGWVTVKSDYLSEKQRRELNEELECWLQIGPLQGRTHIWCADTFLEYMEFLTGEVRARRRQLGLDRKATALIICDCASQHAIEKFFAMKMQWCAQHNIANCLAYRVFLPKYVSIFIYIYFFDIQYVLY